MTKLAKGYSISESTIESFSESISKVNGLSPSVIANQIRTTLLPFLQVASAHPGKAYPSPTILELMDHVTSYGPESLRSQVEKLSLAEPEDDKSALMAYSDTILLLKESGFSSDAECWPAPETIVSTINSYK